MIQPGLERITLLLKHTPLPWKAIHVAGTNGKGSICAIASALLRHSKVRCGRFTSPHLIDRWDCITVDDVPVAPNLFREVEDKYLKYSASQGIDASEFELLTATAFDIFTREKVNIGVVEVGMGGRLDATNVLQKPLVTVISKVSLDHQSWLGSTVEEIARQKAGILKPGVPCIVDCTNDDGVKGVVETVAKEVGAGPIIYSNAINDTLAVLPAWRNAFDLMPDHQRFNTACAYLAVCQALEALGRLGSFDPTDLVPVLKTVEWPGRLQKIQLEPITGPDEYVLLDGAHNADSARVLAEYVNKNLRQRLRDADSTYVKGDGRTIQQPVAENVVTWVIAITDGKDAQEILKPLLRHGDNVITVEFGPVDGMPWVRPSDSKILRRVARRTTTLSHRDKGHYGKDILAGLKAAKECAGDGPIVVAGSLYLVSDILRLKRDNRLGGEGKV